MTLFWKGVRKFDEMGQRGRGSQFYPKTVWGHLWMNPHTPSPFQQPFSRWTWFSHFPLYFFFHLFQKRTFVDKWHMLLRVGCPSCHPSNRVKALKEIQSIEATRSLTHSLTHSLLRLTSEGRSKLHIERSWACDQITSISQSAMTFSMVDLMYASSLLQGDFHLWHW